MNLPLHLKFVVHSLFWSSLFFLKPKFSICNILPGVAKMQVSKANLPLSFRQLQTASKLNLVPSICVFRKLLREALEKRDTWMLIIKVYHSRSDSGAQLFIDSGYPSHSTIVSRWGLCPFHRMIRSTLKTASFSTRNSWWWKGSRKVSLARSTRV